MSYNEKLATSIRKILSTQEEFMERKMFGGLCFLLRGNMCCGIMDERLIIRINGPMYDELLKRKETSIMDFTGKPMRGFLVINENAIKTMTKLQHWLEYAINYALSLPPKYTQNV